jgi:hypothetical protein
MQSSPTPGGSAWWRQPGQPQAPAAPAWVTGVPAQATAPTAPPAAAPPPTAPPPTAPPAGAPPTQQWWERSKGPLGPPPAAAPYTAAPPAPLDIRALLHPSEHSRLVLALSVSLLVFAVVALSLVVSGGSIVLIELILVLIALGASIWLSLQIARSRLLGHEGDIPAHVDSTIGHPVHGR